MSRAPAASVAWHDAENGSYDADLFLWRELAESAHGPVLDLGAGTGRVAADLAAHGHEVVALDADAGLLAVLEQTGAQAGHRRGGRSRLRARPQLSRS